MLKPYSLKSPHIVPYTLHFLFIGPCTAAGPSAWNDPSMAAPPWHFDSQFSALYHILDRLPSSPFLGSPLTPPIISTRLSCSVLVPAQSVTIWLIDLFASSLSITRASLCQQRQFCSSRYPRGTRYSAHDRAQ